MQQPLKKALWCMAAIFMSTLFSRPAVPAQQAQNPIIWADVPDIAMIRVGYAYDTLANNDALRLQNGKNAYGQGSWASSLRYHNGTF